MGGLMVELIYKEEVYAIVGAAMDVYNTLGDGFLEPVYQEALEVEFWKRQIPFIPQREITICYKDVRLKKVYVADFLVYDKLIVEIKAINDLAEREEAQMLNYLKATGMELGVLVNFGSHPNLQWKRMVATTPKYRLPRTTGSFRED
jgi:GxxExxY protein